MQDSKIMSLMAPFQSAYKNKANDQLEGMVGTLRVNAARLVSPEAYWVFTGDDFDLKISDKSNPSIPATLSSPTTRRRNRSSARSMPSSSTAS